MKKFTLFVIAITLIAALTSCSLFMSETVEITSVSFDKASETIGTGGMTYLTLTIAPAETQKNAKVSYSYDENVVSVDGDNYGATVLGIKNGNTTVKANVDGISTACIITVTGVDPTLEDAPQITSSVINIETDIGVSKKVQVALTNATAADMSNFSWSIDKSSVAKIEAAGQTAYITGISAGIAQVTVSHTLAAYSYKFCVFVNTDISKIAYITMEKSILVQSLNTLNLFMPQFLQQQPFPYKQMAASLPRSQC